MQIVKAVLLLILLAFIMPASAQTDSNVVEVDSAFLVPGRKLPRDTAGKDPVRVIDSPRVDPKTDNQGEKEVVKSPARLALERLPRRAVIASAILPGLGQIYNRRWWKVPLVYAGFVGIGLVYNFNQQYYKEFLEEAQYRFLNNGERRNPSYVQYDDQAIQDAKDFYRRNRDLTILSVFGFHVIQIVDAYVDAKFFRYDISDELSLRLSPAIQSQPAYNAYSPIPSLKIKLSL